MKSLVNIMTLIRAKVFTAKVDDVPVIKDCRLSVAESYDKFLDEIKDLSKFPAVVIVAGNGDYSDNLLNREPVFGLVIVQKLSASPEDRAVDLLNLFEVVSGLFPSNSGNGSCLSDDDSDDDAVAVLPGRFYQAQLPDSRAAFVQELRVIQTAD